MNFKMLTCSFSSQDFLSVLQVKDYPIRDEGMNKKIKGNSPAASWSYTLICFNMNLRTTDFKTQLRNLVVHHSKQNIISSNLPQVEILCQGQIT